SLLGRRFVAKSAFSLISSTQGKPRGTVPPADTPDEAQPHARLLIKAHSLLGSRATGSAMRKLPLRAAAFTALGLTAAPALAAGPIEEHTCPTGLTVLVVEDHALPLVTIEIAARNGSMTESPEYNGL